MNREKWTTLFETDANGKGFVISQINGKIILTIGSESICVDKVQFIQMINRL